MQYVFIGRKKKKKFKKETVEVENENVVTSKRERQVAILVKAAGSVTGDGKCRL